MNKFRVLSLDGGGSKGVYTLGVLAEIEALVKVPLWEIFQLIYGTSTGAIIASLLALGKSIPEIKECYFEIIPQIMGHSTKCKRTKALQKEAKKIYSKVVFSDFKTDIGIVATHIDYARPMIFKSSLRQAHGRKNTFSPGFGASVNDAIVASCAAFPFFEKVTVQTINQGSPQLLDGGFVANNPTLFAIADALNAYNIPPDQIRVMSVGVGIYREPSRSIFHEIFLNLWPFWLTRKTLDCNTNTNEIIRSILLPHINCLRINESFAEKDYETDLLETDLEKLEKLYQLGRESFALHEESIQKNFKREK